MGFNFPNTPTIGDLYPTPALPGVPQYRWDGAVWTTTTYDPLTWVQRAGDTMTGALNVVTPPTLPAHAASKAYVDAASVAAAPFADAMAYSGMQVNGGMEVSQENGTSNVPISGSTYKYVVDSWMVITSGTQVINAAQSTGLTMFRNSLLLTVGAINTAPASNDYVLIRQTIEGYRVARLSWGTAAARPITLSFWVAANRAGMYSGSLLNSAGNRCYLFSFTINGAGVLEYKTVTIPGDTQGTWFTDNRAGLVITFAMMAGTGQQNTAGVWLNSAFNAVTGTINGVAAGSDALWLTNVTVLAGIYAPTAAQSPLIMRPYDQELMTCQRYFEWVPYTLGFNSTVGGASVSSAVSFAVTKRAVPTLGTLVADPNATQQDGNAFSNSAHTPTLYGCGLYLQATGVGAAYVYGYRVTASARL